MTAPDPSAPAVSFVVPLYFTGQGIRKLLGAFQALDVPGGYEVILVNDGSTDETLSLARQMLPDLSFPVALVDMARNYGEHAAVLEGYRHARGQFVVNLDDDLQNPISEALKIVEELRRTDFEVIYTYYDEKKHHWFRNFGSWLTNAIATVLLNKPKDLYLSSFRGLRRELVERIVISRSAFPYVDGLILGATNRVGRLKVLHEERADGRSGYTLRRLISLMLNMCFNFSVMPLRIAFALGVVLSVVGALLILAALVETLLLHVKVPGWASLLCVSSLFSGAQLLTLGLVGEYVGRAYLTVSGKLQSCVRSVEQHPAPASR